MILVTGGAGFLGKALIPRLKGKIKVVSRNEGSLIKLKNKHPNIEYITGDVASEWIAHKAMSGVTEVYHLAAMKVIPTAEKQVFACISTNIIGLMNLLKESFVTKPKVFMFISTDKAAQVSGVYGATKFLGEKLVQEAQEINPDTKYRIVRYGNILYSTGSVLCKWKENILNKKEITITDPKMSRYYWTVDQAIDLIFKCIKEAKDATPFIPKMKAMSMGNLLEAMLAKYGNTKVKVIGNRGGENLKETLDGKTYSDEAEQFTIKEIMELI